MAEVTQNIVTAFSATGFSDVMSLYAQLGYNIKSNTGDLQQNVDALKAHGVQTLATRRAYMLLRTEWRMQHAMMIEGARVLRDIGAMGRSVVSMWQAYTLAQTRVADAARDVRSAQSEVVIIQDALNRATRAGDLNLQTDLTLRLANAQDEVARAQRDVAKAQQDNIIGYIGMVMQMGDIIARLPLMALHLSVLSKMWHVKAVALDRDTVSTTANTVVANLQRGTMDAQSASLVNLMVLQQAQPLLYAQSLAGLSADAVARTAHTGAIWGQVAALKAFWVAMGPVGWAILAGAAVIGGAALLGAARGGTVVNLDYHPTVTGGMPGLAEDRDGLIDSLRRRGTIYE